MRKSLSGVLAGALAALALASLLITEAVGRFNPGFARFTPYFEATGDHRIAQPKEMIEIHERNNAEAEFKVHLPEFLNNPSTRDGINCYVGSNRRKPGFSAGTVTASFELCTNQKSELLHEQTELKDSSYRAVRG